MRVCVLHALGPLMSAMGRTYLAFVSAKTIFACERHHAFSATHKPVSTHQKTS